MLLFCSIVISTPLIPSPPLLPPPPTFLPIFPRDGRLKRNDQIVSINGHSLERVPHNDAVKLLQSVRGTVELVIARDQHASLAPPSPPSLSPSKPWRQQWEASPATQSQTLPTGDSSDEGDRDEPNAVSHRRKVHYTDLQVYSLIVVSALHPLWYLGGLYIEHHPEEHSVSWQRIMEFVYIVHVYGH